MSYRYLLTLLGGLLVALGLVERGGFLIAVWLGSNLLILGVAHWRGAHRVFGKRPDGTLPLWSWLVFLPLLSLLTAIWRLIWLCSREPAFHRVTEHLVVGRRLLASELADHFDNYVDLTAEFSEPLALRRSPAYRSFPILDGGAPTPERLHMAVAGLRPGRTYLHCAQGHGRAGLFALAVLLTSGEARTVEEGMQRLKAVRPAICLNRDQNRCIQRYAKRSA